MASLCPPLLPLGRSVVPLLLQTPNSAFPHLCAFAQAAFLPPVNPGFFFPALRSAPSSHWLPWAPPARGRGPSASEPLAADMLGGGEAPRPIPDQARRSLSSSQRLRSEGHPSHPTAGHPGHSPLLSPKVPSLQHPDSGARCLLIFTPQVLSTTRGSSDSSLGGSYARKGGQEDCVTSITLQGPTTQDAGLAPELLSLFNTWRISSFV